MNNSYASKVQDEKLMAIIQKTVSNKLHINFNQATPDANLAEDLGADSLDVIEIAMDLDRVFNIYIPDEAPEQAPQYLIDYIDYYRTKRGYHPRSQGNGKGWNVTGCQSFMNMPILQYSNEIRSAVLMIHGEKAHSVYFTKDAYANMIKDNKYTENKELFIIPGAVHTDLYDQTDIIPFDTITDFYQTYLK